MYALTLCALLIVTPQNPINKHVPADHKTNKTAPKATAKTSLAIPANTPTNQLDSTSHSDQHNKETDDRANRIEVVPQADWWFKGYVIATFFIAGANIAVLITIWRQKIVMSAQLGVMQKQVENAGEQVIAAQGSNNRISHQIRIMQGANEQTNRLIEQTTASAEAATKSSNAFVESERAWINARLVHEAGNDYRLEINNLGRTLGHIVDIRFGTACIVPHTRPKEPYGETVGVPINVLILPNSEFARIQDFKEISAYFEQHWNDILVGTKQAIFFFSINYEDVIKQKHTSSFVYCYRQPTSSFEDMRELRKYT